MLIDVNTMRKLKVDDTVVKYKLIKQNIERFFRDYIYYFNIYERDELIIDSGYLPYHYLDSEVLTKIISLLEVELGYAIIIMKITNTYEKGYRKGDLINIRLFDLEKATFKELDDYFNLRMYQAIYSTMHEFNNILGEITQEKYLSCKQNLSLIQSNNECKLDNNIENNNNNDN